MDTSKYSKLFVKNLKDFTTTLDKVVETFELISQDKKNSDEKLYDTLMSSSDIMKQVADSLNKINRIEQNVQSIQNISKNMLSTVQQSQSTLISSTESMAEASRDSVKYQKQQNDVLTNIGSRMDQINDNIKDVKSTKEKGFADKLGKGNANKMLDGIKVIVLMAAAIVAIGLALMLIGEVNFKSVLALAVILPVLAYTMAKIAEIKGLDPKSVAYIGLSLVAMSMAIVATSWILMLTAEVGIIKIANAVMIAIAMLPIAWAMKAAQESIEDLSLKTLAKALIFMPILALSIALTSWALVLVAPISPYTLISVIAISIATMFMAKAADYFSDIKIKDMAKILLMPLLLPIIAGAIALASIALSKVQPVNNLFAVLTASLAVMIMMIPFGIMMKFIKGLNSKEVAKGLITIGIVAIGMPALLVAVSEILPYIKEITFKTLANTTIASIALLIIAVTAGLIIGINKKFKVDQLDSKGLAKIGIVLLAISAMVVTAGAVLQHIVPISLKTLLDIGITSLALGIIALTAGVIIKIFDYFNITEKKATVAGIAMVGLAGVILAVSHILSKGDYTNAPPMSWSIGMGLLFTIMSLPIAILGKLGISTVAQGSLGLVIMAGAIMAAMYALSLGEQFFKKDGLVYLLVDAFLYLADGLAEIVVKVLKSGIIDGLISIVKGVGEVLNMIIGTVLSVLPAIINALTPIIKIIGDVLKSVMPIIKDIIVAVLPLVQGIIDFLGKIVEGIVAIVQVIGDVINKVLSSFVSAFKILMDAVATVTFSQLAGFAAGFLLVSAALIPFLAEMVIATVAIPTMLSLGYALDKLLGVAKTDFDGAEFATKLGFMGEGLKNFSNNLPSFWSSIGSSAGAIVLSEAVLTLSTAAMILNKTDTSTFKTNLGNLADGLVDFANKMNTLGLDKMQMVKVPGLIFDGEIPAPLLAVQIAATAADIVNKVKMTASDADAFILGMTTLAKGIGAFMDNLKAIGDGAKAALSDQVVIGSSIFGDRKASTLLIGLEVASAAANIVAKVKMKKDDVVQFLTGMMALAMGIDLFINNLKSIGEGAKSALSDRVDVGWFSSGTPTLLLGLEIAGKAADIVSKTKLDEAGRKNFESTMTMLPTVLKSFIDGLAQAKISPEQLTELAGVFEFLQKYMGPLVAVLPSISALNGPQLMTNMTSMGTGINSFFTGIKGLKVSDAVLMAGLGLSMKQVAEVKFDIENLNQAAVAFDKLSASIDKFSNMLKKYSETIKKDNFVANLKSVIHSLLTYSVIDVDNLNKVNESMSTSVKKVSEIMVKNNETPGVVEPEKIEKTDLEKDAESKEQEAERKKQEELKTKAEEEARIKAEKEAAQQKMASEMASNTEDTNKKLDKLIDIMEKMLKALAK